MWLLAAGLTRPFTARLSVGHQGDSTQLKRQVAGAEQPTGWGAWDTASQLEEADLVWTGTGQADSIPAAFVGAADGGGWATGDAAAPLSGATTAGHDQELARCWVLLD